MSTLFYELLHPFDNVSSKRYIPWVKSVLCHSREDGNPGLSGSPSTRGW